jgi:hypothetical protein
MPFMCTPSTRKGQPAEIITDNSVETVVFDNTDIPHPCNNTVSQRSVARSSRIYIMCVCLCVSYMTCPLLLELINLTVLGKRYKL